MATAMLSTGLHRLAPLALPPKSASAGSRDVTFVSVGASATRAAIASNIASSTNKATTISFEGDNYFSGSLSLFSNGAISQTAGKIDLASGNSLALSGTTISLAGTSNAIGSLGAITATTGSIAITTSAAMTLNGNISAGGAIGLTATGMTLGSAVTTSGGAVTIDLGTGTYSTGSGNGFILTTTNQSLTLIAGRVTATAEATVFALGTTNASATLTAAGLSPTTGASTTNFWNYDSAGTNNKGSTEILAGDPMANGITKWKFYGATKGTEATDTAWMDSKSLAAGKVIKVVTSGNITAGLATKDGDGNVKYRAASAGIAGTPEDVSLSGSRHITFDGVGVSGTPVTVGTLPTALSVVFSGANFFSGDLTLNATGSITQTSGAGNTLSVTGGKLIVSGSSAITLTNTGNALGSLGALTSTGSIAITTGAG